MTTWNWALICGGAGLTTLFLYDIFQTKHAVRRNFPVIGLLRYLLESVGPELRQYLFQDDRGEKPIPRYVRSWIYASSKHQLNTLPFGTRKDLDKPGTVLIRHSMYPKPEMPSSHRVVVGPKRKHPYHAHLFNISSMSYGALSRNAVLALSKGAKAGGFAMWTGEGGLSPYHQEGGADIVFQFGTGKFGVRTVDGEFDESLFREVASSPQVKMIEIKLSQGAKPGHGGVLPGAKVTEEIARIRHVKPGVDCISPPAHKEWKDARGLLEFVTKLQTIAEKPVGFKFCLGRIEEVDELCRIMRDTGMHPDFMTIDGAEGGTGAAPLGLSDYLGYPAHDAIMMLENKLLEHGMREQVRIIASGKIFTGAHLALAVALGADMANSARGFMLSIGCIHALKCNSNHCPTGITTHREWLQRGLVPGVKAPRVARYQESVIEEFNMILHACGYAKPEELTRSDVVKVIGHNKIQSMEDLVPYSAPCQEKTEAA